MSQENEEKLSLEDIRYLKVAISLAICSPDIVEMPKTKLALDLLSEKVGRMYLEESNRGKT